MGPLARGEGARSGTGALHTVCAGRPYARSGWQNGYRRQCCAMQCRALGGLERHEVGKGKCFPPGRADDDGYGRSLASTGEQVC
jgi:hypothetical protein